MIPSPYGRLLSSGWGRPQTDGHRMDRVNLHRRIPWPASGIECIAVGGVVIATAISVVSNMFQFQFDGNVQPES